MKKLNLILLLAFASSLLSFCNAQSNEICTYPSAEHVMLGNYNPATYLASNILNRPDTIFKGINNRVSPDSLKSYIFTMAGFYNRNTASDTISSLYGIGAATRWAYSKFQEFSNANQNRLLPGYLQFTFATCGVSQHRNVIA